ncbi:MAG TPA: SRPBCC family protein [Pyrinomonadaceae bacterium]|nr:SRPBCC family protein [Pyrinomonadaceae bacterium]
MPRLQLEMEIDAPPEACFALLRDPRLHTETLAVHEGDFALGQRVRFESEMLGIKQVMVVEVTEFDPPHRVTDTMISGTFRVFRHTHEFTEHNGGTLMSDVVVWRSPLGPLGRLADRLLLRRKLRRLITGRNLRLKALAEAPE